MCNVYIHMECKVQSIHSDEMENDAKHFNRNQDLGMREMQKALLQK